MASTTDFACLTNRILSFNDSQHTRNNKQQGIFNLALCGYYFVPHTDPSIKDYVRCHACHIELSDWNECQLEDQGYMSSLHRTWCSQYKYSANSVPSEHNKDVRVLQSNTYDYIDSASVCVVVGTEPESREFSVHQDLIHPRSEFFKNAMNGSWKESDERKVPLPEDEPETFSLYLKLLYTGKLPLKDIDPDIFDSDMVADEYASLSKLFVLAEKLIDKKSKELVLAAMLARSEEPFTDKCLYYPALDSIQIIYEGTPEDSPARRLLVELYTAFGNAAFMTTKSDVIPKDFLYDLSLSVLGTRPLLKVHTDLKSELFTKNKEINSKMEQAALQESTIQELKKENASLSATLQQTIVTKNKTTRILETSPELRPRSISPMYIPPMYIPPMYIPPMYIPPMHRSRNILPQPASR